MTQDQQQWLLSLSAISQLGPEMDVDHLSSKGFYRKIKSGVAYIDRHIDISKKPYKNYTKEIDNYLKIWQVRDKVSFISTVEELIQGSDFGVNMHRLVEIGRMMTLKDRMNKQTFLINGHPYLFDLFEYVMVYEHHFPQDGFLAYDIANAIMLLRLGLGKAYISEKEQTNYFDTILEKGTGRYSSYKQFGTDATIARNIHEKQLNVIDSSPKTKDFKPYLSIAYYGIWQWFESLNITSFI